MTRKEQQEYEIAIKKVLLPLTISMKIKVMEKLGKEFRQANNLEISKEIYDFSKKIKRSV